MVAPELFWFLHRNRNRSTNQGHRGVQGRTHRKAACLWSYSPSRSVAETHSNDGGGNMMSRAHFDSTISFLREGYAFISSRCDRLNTDVFTSRIGLLPVTFIRGAEAAELFYEGDRFTHRVPCRPPFNTSYKIKARSKHSTDDHIGFANTRFCP